MTRTYSVNLNPANRYIERDVVFYSRQSGMPSPDFVLLGADTITFAYEDGRTIDVNVLDAWQDAVWVNTKPVTAPWYQVASVNEQIDQAVEFFETVIGTPTPMTRDEMWAVIQAILGVTLPLLRSMRT